MSPAAKGRELAEAIRRQLADACPTPRSVLSYDEALGTVVRATGWPVGHAWVRVGATWRSSGAWYDAGPRYTALHETTAVTDLGSGRGIVAAVLHLEACRFLPGLDGLGSALRAQVAADAGLRAVVGVPVRTQRKLAAVFEFVAVEAVEPEGELAEALLEVARRARRRVPRRPAAGTPALELPEGLAG